MGGQPRTCPRLRVGPRSCARSDRDAPRGQLELPAVGHAPYLLGAHRRPCLFHSRWRSRRRASRLGCPPPAWSSTRRRAVRPMHHSRPLHSGQAAPRLSDRTEIRSVVHDWPHVADPKGHEVLRPPRSRDELDLETIRFIRLNDRTKIALPKTTLRRVTVKNDGVELFELHRVIPGMRSRTAEPIPPRIVSLRGRLQASAATGR